MNAVAVDTTTGTPPDAPPDAPPGVSTGPPPEAASGDDSANPEVVALLVADLDRGFEDVVRRYQGDVYSVAIRVCGRSNRQDAEDLAAEVFLLAYRALLGFDRERVLALRVRSWLLTILLNTWRNSVRTSARRPRQAPLSMVLPTGLESTPAQGLPSGGSGGPPGRPSSLSAVEPLSPDAAELAERNETSRELAELLALLPERQRLAVVLRHVVGLPVGEVAEVLGVPENTVKSHTSRGLAALRSLYRKSSQGKENP